MRRVAARTVGNLVYLHLTANSKLTDGKVPFHVDHKNFIAKGTDTMGLNEARKAMHLQEDANGSNQRYPAYILVSAVLKGAANRAVPSSSSLLPVGQNGTLSQNPCIINVVKDI